MNPQKTTKNKRNYFVDAASFLPFLFLLLTGIVMLAYHGGKAYTTETLGLTGTQWSNIHKTLTLIAVPLVLLHILLHYVWLKKLFTAKLRNKHKGMNTTLLVVFTLCALTAISSWLIFPNTVTASALRGIHNKLGLLLILLFTVHVLNYYKWFAIMTKRIMKK